MRKERRGLLGLIFIISLQTQKSSSDLIKLEESILYYFSCKFVIREAYFAINNTLLGIFSVFVLAIQVAYYLLVQTFYNTYSQYSKIIRKQHLQTYTRIWQFWSDSVLWEQGGNWWLGECVWGGGRERVNIGVEEIIACFLEQVVCSFRLTCLSIPSHNLLLCTQRGSLCKTCCKNFQMKFKLNDCQISFTTLSETKLINLCKF